MARNEGNAVFTTKEFQFSEKNIFSVTDNYSQRLKKPERVITYRGYWGKADPMGVHFWFGCYKENLPKPSCSVLWVCSLWHTESVAMSWERYSAIWNNKYTDNALVVYK